MPKLVICALLLFLFAGMANTQDTRELRLRKIQARLSRLSGTERIDCLNRIAQRMMDGSYTRWDSSLYYSKLAIEEASQQGYHAGLCKAHIIHGDGLLQFQRSREGEKFFLEAIRLGEKYKLDTLLNMAHRRLGQSYWYQGKFQLAIDEISGTINFFRASRDTFQLINCFTSIGSIYNDWGNYEKGLEYSQQALKLSLEAKENDNTVHCYVMIGNLYAGIGDYQAAFESYHQASNYLDNCNDCYQKRLVNSMKGTLHRTLGNYDSSMYYLLTAYKGNPTSTLTKLFIAETLIAQQRYDTALQVLLDLKKYHQQNGDGARYWQLSTAIGAAYYGKGQFMNAIQFTRDGLQLGFQRGLKGQYILDALHLMSTIYKKLGQTDSALAYFESYAQMKDSVNSDRLKGQLFEFKRIAEDEKSLAQIELLKRQKEISEQQLKWQQRNARQNLFLKNILIAGIILMGLLSLIIFRNISLKRKNERLKNQQLQAQLQHKATELEMQALRAQMNPHFIFNCLSSINRFILKNETEAASDYLTRFSRLIRLVLVHSRSSLILLKDEIEMLKLYLDMEQLRFKNAFDYTISFSNSIDPETIYIPPLLLQPFCENAIWHGLMHKEGRGHLDIIMSLRQNQLKCIISDNGIGRVKAMEYKSRSGEMQKSLGLKITSERLALINEEKGVQTSYEIEDLVDNDGLPAGTKVILSIRYSRPVEELA
ncbi:MAG TPA: histidine kinase [Chitinophagaceae bacterium]|nr:histidine kinase [Chitinophagaceae bacterium]